MAIRIIYDKLRTLFYMITGAKKFRVLNRRGYSVLMSFNHACDYAGITEGKVVVDLDNLIVK